MGRGEHQRHGRGTRQARAQGYAEAADHAEPVRRVHGLQTLLRRRDALLRLLQRITPARADAYGTGERDRGAGGKDSC